MPGVDPDRQPADALDVEPRPDPGEQVFLAAADEDGVRAVGAHVPARRLRRVTTSDGKREAATHDSGSHRRRGPR